MTTREEEGWREDETKEFKKVERADPIRALNPGRWYESGWMRST